MSDYLTHQEPDDTPFHTQHVSTEDVTADVAGRLVERQHEIIEAQQTNARILEAAAVQSHVAIQIARKTDDEMSSTLTEEVSHDIPVLVRIFFWAMCGILSAGAIGYIIHLLGR